MAYLGKVELKASDIRTSGVQTISGSATNTVTLGGAAPSVQSVILTINGVTQATNTYTISGSTLTLVSGNFTDGDVVEAVTINDVGTTIAPADGSVTLPKISAGRGTAGQYLKTDGVETLSWSTIADEIPTQTGQAGKFLTTDGSTTSWGSTGAAESVFWENAQTVSSDYTITASTNALTLGNLTINSGITVTVPSGARWYIL